MSEHNFEVGQCVKIVGKNLYGRIAYVGLTHFSTGQWIGVVLNEQKGKNNGCIKGVTYFKCAKNYGLFVRPKQLIASEVDNTTLIVKSSVKSINMATNEEKLTSTVNTTVTAEISKRLKPPTGSPATTRRHIVAPATTAATASTTKIYNLQQQQQQQQSPQKQLKSTNKTIETNEPTSTQRRTTGATPITLLAKQTEKVTITKFNKTPGKSIITTASSVAATVATTADTTHTEPTILTTAEQKLLATATATTSTQKITEPTNKATKTTTTTTTTTANTTVIDTTTTNAAISSSSTTNALKTTKIIQPKQAKTFLSSSSHFSLYMAATQQQEQQQQEQQQNSTAIVTPSLPKRSKTMVVSPTETFCCAKRANSFVETGFLKIFRPQFTPGHPLRSPTTSMQTLPQNEVTQDEQKQLNKEKQHELQQHPFYAQTRIQRQPSHIQYQLHTQQAAQQRNKCQELESTISNLTFELNDLKQQRADDRLKIIELEKFKVQHEQLLEFKTKIMEQHSLLQRELQRARQENREINDSIGKYKRELEEMSENIEILTLDKEMAEEKTETIQIELEMAQERLEELTLDLEIIRAEQENDGPSILLENCAKTNENILSAGEIKKMEQCNLRLRETVLRLRDALTLEKQQLQKSTKELETKYSEITELKKTKEILSKRVDVLEMHIMDLKEQVDATLGSDKMIESLADVKLELEERVKLLEDEVSELEALEEIHEQLIESNQELEMDLREEIDALNSTIKNLRLEKDNALEAVYDRDITIIKFRELVKQLNEQLQIQLKDLTGTSTSDDMSAALSLEETQSIDFNQVFTVTKAYGRSIDVQLNTVDLKLCKLHIEYLQAFVPEDIMLRGSEHDIILVLLLLQRISEKIDLICNAINEKFPSSCEFGKDAIFEGYSVHRFAFHTRSVYLLRNLKLVLQQLSFGLNHCEYEVCTQAAIYRNEIENQEKCIDELLKLLKSGLLDENTSLDVVERTVNFFNALYTNLITPHELPELVDEQQMYVSLMAVFEPGFDCINTYAAILHTIIRLGDEHTESFQCMQFLMKTTSDFKQRIRKIQRKLPQHNVNNVVANNLTRERMQQIQITNANFGRLINILHAAAKEATKNISTTKDVSSNDISIEHERLWKILTIQCIKFSNEEHQKPDIFFEHTIDLLEQQLQQFNDFVKENENARNSNINTVFIRSTSSTLLQRAAQFKQHFDNIKQIKDMLTDREKEIKTLKYLSKMKQNDFSEMQIRKEITERNLNKFINEQEQALHNICKLIEQLEQMLIQKEITILKSIEKLTEKLEHVEQTHQALQQNLDTIAKVAFKSTDETTRELMQLHNCLRQERKTRIRLQTGVLMNNMKYLTPIFVPKQNEVKDRNLCKLENELRALKNQWILNYITLTPTINAKVNGTKQTDEVLTKTDDLAKHIIDCYFEEHPYRAAASAFGRFSSKELRQHLLE